MVIVIMVTTPIMTSSNNDSVGNNDYIKNLLYKILVLAKNLYNSGL